MSSRIKIVTTELSGEEPVRIGNVVTATAITGANVLRDVREAITNTLGGKMTRYEKVVDETIDRALENLASKASEQGYDGIVRMQISHTNITDGAIEIVVVGTGYWRASPAPST